MKPAKLNFQNGYLSRPLAHKKLGGMTELYKELISKEAQKL